MVSGSPIIPSQSSVEFTTPLVPMTTIHAADRTALPSSSGSTTRMIMRLRQRSDSARELQYATGKESRMVAHVEISAMRAVSSRTF